MTNDRLAAHYQNRAAAYFCHAAEARERHISYVAMPGWIKWLYGPSNSLPEWRVYSTLAEAYACTARLLMGHAA